PSGLAPLQQLEDELGERSGTDLSPIEPDRVPREIREVVRALNALFDRLGAANRGQRQFLQDAAHQLRTPLASLQMQIELLDAQPADSVAFVRLKNSVVRVTRLANQLLALARAEAGSQLMASAVPVDLAALIDDMVEGWLQQADAHAIDLGIERVRAIITGDPTLLRELIANLMDNALRYTPPGGEVSLRCAPVGELMEIEVSDSGPGIPEPMREAVFERFYRLADTKLSGSGLGLPIAREIVLCHRGSIEITDGPGGRGTLVRVKLPITPRHEKMQPGA
ncbi:MAG: sensor histidine kinase, partial [Betaproteobacteria bacterium HGW-Betaproteobacteria-21]